MNHVPVSIHSPFATGFVPAGIDDLFPRTEDDANGNRDSSGYTVGTGGTLTASPNATYTYDASGHLTAKTDTSTGKVTTFAYDHRDRLTGITRNTSGGTVDYRTTYVYDALNRRIAEQVDADGAGAGSPVTTWTVFDGENPYADFNGAGTLTQRYLHGAAVDALLARSDASGVTDWYLTDRLGSVRDVVDTSGTVLYHTGYDSFGNKVSSSGSGGDRFGFTGREHDAALNLYYYRARFYDPATGRFVSKDPLGYDAGDANLYRYVGNGPTNGTDPSGMSPFIIILVDTSNAPPYFNLREVQMLMQKIMKSGGGQLEIILIQTNLPRSYYENPKHASLGWNYDRTSWWTNSGNWNYHPVVALSSAIQQPFLQVFKAASFLYRVRNIHQ